MRAIVILMTTCLALLVPSLALGWDGNAYWWDPAQGGRAQPYDIMPGAGGIIATGGALDHNITCADCHIKSAGQIDAAFTFDGMPLTSYLPGHTYQVTAKLLYEHLGLSGCSAYVTGNVNNFGATFEDGQGNLAGMLSSDGNTSGASCQASMPQSVSGTTLVYGDCHAITSASTKDLTRWAFSWTAPAQGTGDVTLYYGMVDGNCMMDSLNDDVKVGNIKLSEGKTMGMAEPRAGHAGTTLACLGLYPAIGIVAALRRRKRR